MVKQFTAALLICLFANNSLAKTTEIVLAFDDVLSPSTSLSGLARTKMLLNNMAKADAHQAMFFIQTHRINTYTSDQVEFLNTTNQLLVNAGDHYSPYLRKKNHTYTIDLLKANAKLRAYENYHQHVNAPYLYERGDENLLLQVQDFLKTHNYNPTYVTTRAMDNYLDSLYQIRARNGGSINMRSLGKAYSNMILDQVRTYDAQAFLLLGFSPRQVLLLHLNDLTAYCILDLIDALNANGYKIVSPEKTINNPILNPYRISGFSAVSYLPYITGIKDTPRTESYITTKNKEEIVHQHLREEGLDAFIP
jgi:peptidoglycan-N-acetylglucosamine deacetylase